MQDAGAAIWLPPQQEEEWLHHARGRPILPAASFAFWCWTCFVGVYVKARMNRTAAGTDKDKNKKRTPDERLYGQNFTALMHATLAMMSAAWLILSRFSDECMPGRLFCFVEPFALVMDMELGYVVFETIYSSTKTGSWLMRMRGPENALLFIMLMLQRYYPNIAGLRMLPWWLATHVSSFFFATDGLLAARRAALNAMFVNEMLRMTGTVFKLLTASLLAYSVSRWIWDVQLTALELPYGLNSWSWAYSYCISAGLCFLAWIAFKQLQQGVAASNAKVKQYEKEAARARRRAEGKESSDEEQEEGGRRGGRSAQQRKERRRERSKR